MRRALALVALLVAASACSYATRQAHPYRPAIVEQPGSAQSGQELYMRDCAWCHGAAGLGTPRAPDLVTGTNGPAFTHFMLTTGRMPLEYPSQRSVRRPTAYDPEQIEALVEYVDTFGAEGPTIPTVAPGTLSLGQVLYAENCAACHAPTLIGGALATVSEGETRGVTIPGLRHSTPTEIAEAMLVGPGTMPVFGPDTFTPAEVNAIVSYVEALEDPVNRGGTPIGYAGPVTEGAVGWIVGLGLLLIASRWIGTRTGDR
jgi:ubiquinol-cytochrome c reductase cytochrome c subunit